MNKIILMACFIFFGLLLITGCGNIQKTDVSCYSVSGYVRETGTAQPIANSEIRFNDPFEAVSTNADGYWKKDKLYGNVTISPKITGWYFDKMSVSVHNNTNNINFNGTKFRFVFQSDRTPYSDYNIYFRDGANETPVTTSNFNCAPDLAHLSTKVLFASDDRPDSGGTHQIYAINTNGTGLTKLTSSGAMFPDWSYDDSKIVYESGGLLYTMNSDGSNQTVIPGSISGDRTASWSPDGQYITFCYDIGVCQVYSMNINGSERTRLTYSSYVEEYPAWSPDGSKIAFGSARDGGFQIWVMDANGNNQQKLTSTGGSHPAWTPDSSKIFFVSNRDGQNELYIMDANGSNQTRLTFNARSDVAPSSLKRSKAKSR